MKLTVKPGKERNYVWELPLREVYVQTCKNREKVLYHDFNITKSGCESLVRARGAM